MEGDRVDEMEIISPTVERYSSVWDMLHLEYLLEKRRIVFIVKNTIRNIIKKIKNKLCKENQI